jgi:hypothetical protein
VVVGPFDLTRRRAGPARPSARRTFVEERGAAAVDHEVVAVDEAALVARQVERGGGDVVADARPGERRGPARLRSSFSCLRRLASSSSCEATADPPQKMGVAIAPGEMALTLMPDGPSSPAASRVTWLTAAFAAEYTIPPCPARWAAMLELLMIDPPPAPRITGRRA